MDTDTSAGIAPSVEAPATTPKTPARKAPARKRSSQKRGTTRKAGAARRRATAPKSHKGQKFSFAKIGLRTGAILASTFYPNVKVRVKTDRTVVFKGKEVTLTAAAMSLARRKGKKWPSIQGPAYFTHKGEKLTDLVH
jgi:hypothetical protein